MSDAAPSSDVSPRSGMDHPAPPPPPAAGSGEKVWPGTYNLGRDEGAVYQAQDDWDLSDPRKPRLLKVRHLLRDSAGKPTGKNGVAFKILQTLGRGAQGYVFKAEDISENDHGKPGRIVALKCFDKRKLKQEQERNTLRNPAIWHEFQLLRRVGHMDGIVEIDDHVLETDTFFFVSMEYIEGKDLHHLLWPRTGRPDRPPVDVKAVYRTVMESMAYCHGQGVAHRDLKPSNVMIDMKSDGSAGPGGIKMKAKVMDFGLGAEVPTGPDGKPMQMRRPVGTTAWCAPEILDLFGELMKPESRGGAGGLGPTSKAGTQWQEEKGLGYYARPADVWSSGVLLYEMLTCNPLFHRPEINPREQGPTENRSVRAWKGFPQSLREEQKQYLSGSWPGTGEPYMTDEAKDLLAKILVPDPQARLKAQEIVDHPFLKK